MKKLSYAVLIALVVGLVGCDHATKRVAQSELRDQEDITLVSGVIDLRYTENRGVGFNVLRGIPDGVRRPLILAVHLLAIPILVFFWYQRRRSPRLKQVALAVLLAGALGNLVDRVLLGYVIDFIHVHYWPIFNVADICITVGILLFLPQGVLSRRARAAPA